MGYLRWRVRVPRMEGEYLGLRVKVHGWRVKVPGVEVRVTRVSVYLGWRVRVLAN